MDSAPSLEFALSQSKQSILPSCLPSRIKNCLETGKPSNSLIAFLSSRTLHVSEGWGTPVNFPRNFQHVHAYAPRDGFGVNSCVN